MPSYIDALDRIIEEVIAPSAQEIDRDGSFPAQAVDALGKAGLLGLTSAKDVGGQGEGLRAAVAVIERIAGVCGSTAMVTMMHYSAVPTIEAYGPAELRRKIAAGVHLTTLALSESGSRSHFWSPLSTATRSNNGIALNARKSWITSAGEAQSYVWSSRPLQAEGPMTLWLVPSDTAGLSQPSSFDGLGLRGNGSSPVTAEAVAVDESAMLGEDGKGLDTALTSILPTFLILNSAVSLGIMEAVTSETAKHLGTARFEELDRTLGQGVTARLEFARMRLAADKERCLLNDALNAIETQRPDAMLRVLESKASAAEAAITVTDLAMKVGGGSAFRKELSIERHFRDARAARVMAPTTDALLDFIGRSLLGLPLLDEAVP